ncbi:MAG: hypothetical protein IJ853_04130 [Rickettsiales bacterium]|nr:hypothetical protein [Rickettsiales bacterium]
MFDKLKKYGNLNTYDIYKSLAFILMVIDHVGYYFLPSARLLRVIGRTSMIIFAVLHGFNRKKSSNNNRILIYAVLLFIFVQLLIENDPLPLNVLFNFYISYYLLDKIEEIYKNDYVFFLLICAITLLLSGFTNIFLEYGAIFWFLILCGRIFNYKIKTPKDKVTAPLIFIMYYIYQTIHFNFNLINSIVLLILIVLTYILLYNFSFKTYNKNNTILMILSRFSLELYFIHLLIFSIIYAYIR